MSSGSVQPDIEPRTIRATTEIMTVIEEADALFSVTTESGSEYTVDLREPACTCPDFEYRASTKECKHIRRVRIEVGQVDLDHLEAEFRARIDELESEAETLTTRAEELTETVTELETAVEQLPDVTSDA